jgi:hypothetical protein
VITISGVAVPLNEWISINAGEDKRSPRCRTIFRPGAFAAAIGRTDGFLTIDHEYRQHRKLGQLASQQAGTLTLYEMPAALVFQADLTHLPHSGQRIVKLIEAGFIQHCCLRMTSHPIEGYQPGADVEVFQVPRIESLGLMLFQKPHSYSTTARVGPLGAIEAIEVPPLQAGANADSLVYRVLA